MTGRSPLVLAALTGLVHAGFSAYWGLGGTWLLATLGARVLDAFAGLGWVLLLVFYGGLNSVVALLGCCAGLGTVARAAAR